MIARLSHASFAELVAFSEILRRERPSTLQLCETRIAHALAAQRAALTPPIESDRAHRCDLARAWCLARGLPVELAPRALVCEGVRHALRLLMPVLGPLALPSDVYPVYETIAREAGVSFHAFTTWPDLALERVLDACAHAGARAVLLPFPLKQHARAWTAHEVDVARSWLAADADRRLVLDGVYSFGAPASIALRALLETDRVIHLDSMSKGWLHERTFGVALIPERDRSRLTEVVRASPPSRANLIAARELLAHHALVPSQVVAAIDACRERLMSQLSARAIPFTPCERGYLVTIEVDADALLSSHDVLAIPASVFGSTRSDRSFASALSLA